ncbi:MAG: hypothetical protein WDO19_12220 [Bacteroidota bacterium]
MKKIFKNILVLLAVNAFFSSCLKKDLDPLPAFNDTNIDRFDFEYRWDDNGTFRVVRFNTDAPVPDNKTLSVTTTVPAASGSFTEAVRNQVNATNIVAMCNISTAASIAPAEGSPQLGIPGDFSKTVIYDVTAADGITKERWTVNVIFVK